MKILLPLIFILLSAGIYLGYIDGAYDRIKTLQVEEKEYDTALKRSEDLNAIHDRLLGTYNSIETAELDRLQKLLPDSVDTIRLLIDIDGIAAQNGLALRNLSATPQKTGGESGTIGVIEVGFGTVAPYGTFKNFLRDLESSLRIFDVQSVSFNSVREVQGASAADGYSFNVSFETYWMN